MRQKSTSLKYEPVSEPLHIYVDNASAKDRSKSTKGGWGWHRLGGLAEVVVRDLREEVVHHVRADVVVNLRWKIWILLGHSYSVWA